MKKLFLVMVLASAFTLSACGGSNNDAASEPQTEQGAQAGEAESGADDEGVDADADTDAPAGDNAEAEGEEQRDPNHARPSELKTNYKGEDITYESALINSNIGFDILVDEDNFEYKAEDNAIHIISKDNMEVYYEYYACKIRL